MTHTVYTSCQAGTAVELYAIELLGHMRPETYVLPVSQVFWDFFVAHPKP
jgi:poly(3-hydroxybutyrate) depolymerase